MSMEQLMKTNNQIVLCAPVVVVARFMENKQNKTQEEKQLLVECKQYLIETKGKSIDHFLQRRHVSEKAFWYYEANKNSH